MLGPEKPKIAIRGLSKAFAGTPVLRDLDLDIAPGESLVVIGGSGTGKSVLLKCLIGLLVPDSGCIELDGEAVLGLSRHRRAHITRRFGMLFQNGALFDSLSVIDNVAFGLIHAQQLPAAAAHRVAGETLTLVGLGDNTARLPAAALSAGMRKRVGLARAIAMSPEVLLFDEPTTGLDPVMGDVIDALIVKCVTELGATALTITHDMDSARRIGHRIAMLHGGRIIWSGPADDVERSGNPHVEQFVHGRLDGPIAVARHRPGIGRP